MLICPNCPHAVYRHNTTIGCGAKGCQCPMDDFRPSWTKEESVTYEDAKPTANPDRVKVADTQVGGEHYRQTGIQPWDIIDAWGLDFYAGNALKYLYRAGRKGPKVEDLKKARHYIDKMIEKEES